MLRRALLVYGGNRLLQISVPSSAVKLLAACPHEETAGLLRQFTSAARTSPHRRRRGGIVAFVTRRTSCCKHLDFLCAVIMLPAPHAPALTIVFAHACWPEEARMVVFLILTARRPTPNDAVRFPHRSGQCGRTVSRPFAPRTAVHRTTSAPPQCWAMRNAPRSASAHSSAQRTQSAACRRYSGQTPISEPQRRPT